MDYDSTADQVIFAASDTADKTVTVAINDESIVEAAETFTASLSTATPLGTRNTDFTDTGTGTITNDDTSTLTISGVSRAEGTGGGTTSFDFVVTLSNPVQGGVNVDAQTNDGTAIDGTAATTADSDYTAMTGTRAFAGTAGETETFTVQVGADNRYELDEQFTVTLSGVAAQGPGVNSSDISIVASPATGTIVNDDNDIIETGTAGDDTWTITATDSNSGTFQHGAGPAIPFTGIDSVSFSGLGGADELVIINPAGGAFAPTGGILFEGGSGSDSLVLNGGTVNTLGFSHTNANDGFVDYEGSRVITFTGLEPLTNTGTATDIVFQLPSLAGGNFDVRLSDDGFGADPDGNTANMSAIDGSTFEFTQFTNPSGSLTINMGATGDAISVQGLDAGFDANLTVNQGAGTDTVTFQTNATNIGTGAFAITADIVNVDAALLTTGPTGAVDIDAADDVVFAATGSITATGSGSVLITADADSSGGGTGGALAMADGSSIDAGSGPIALSADEDVRLGRLVTTNNTPAAVSITSVAGRILDNGDAGGEDIEATGILAVVTVNAATGGGATGPVETKITSLSFAVSGSGSVSVAETDAIVLTSVSTNDGSIQVWAAGEIVATNVQSGGGGSVNLHTTTGDIEVGSVTSAGTAMLAAAAGSLRDATGATLTVTNLASLSGTSITLGDNAGDTTNFGALAFSSAGAVFIQEDSDTVIAGINNAASLDLDSAGSITDAAGTSLAATVADFNGTSITLGDNPGDSTHFGSLTFNSAGTVAIQEDSNTVITGSNTAGLLDLDSAGWITDAAGTSLTVAGLADFNSPLITLGDNAGDATHFGSQTFNSAGPVTIQEDSDTVISGSNTAVSLDLGSAGSITDAAGTSLTVTVNADFAGTSIALDETNAFGTLTVNSAGAVQIVEADATVIAGSNTAASLDLDSGGSIADAAGTSLTVAGLADLLGASITLGDNAGDTTNFGSLTFNSAAAVSIQEDSASVITSGNTVNGPIDILAAGQITATDVQSGGGPGDGVSLRATAGDILVGSITSADTALLTADVGAITDNLAGEAANITAGEMALRAASGIGSDAEDINTQGITLAAQTQSGDVNVGNVGALTIGTVDGLAGVTITNGDGTATGLDNITITAASPLAVGNAVLNNDGGNVTLAAEGATPADDLDVNANVSAAGGNGNINLFAGDSIDVATTVTITAAGTGSVLANAGADIKLNVGSTVSAGGDVTLQIGANNTGGSGEVLGTIQTDGRAVHVNGGDGDDSLTVNLTTAILPANGLAFDGGNDSSGTPADELLLIKADGDTIRDIVCISDTAGRIRWRKGLADPTGVFFRYENTETLDLQTKGGDDQVTFNMAPASQTVVRLNAGADSGSANAILDGFRVIGTGGSDQILVGIASSGQRFEIDAVESLQVFGEDGNDTVLNDTAVPSLIGGGDGDDSLTGGSASDVIFGGGGQDTIHGEGGNDYLFPDHAFNRNDGTTSEIVVPGESVLGGAGFDTVVAFGDSVGETETSLIEGGTIDIVMWLIGNLPTPTPVAISNVFTEALANPWTQLFVACPAPPPVPLGVSPSPLAGISATPLGTVAFEQLGGLNVSSGELWYSLQTSHRGLLTIQAAFDAQSDQLQVELYDTNGNLLLNSTANDAGARLDRRVEPAETYYAKLVGTSANVDLTLVNLLDHFGTSVTVDGTDDDDTFTFDASASRLVAVNGVEYEFDKGDVATVTFAGNGGTDSLSLFDSPGDDSFVANPDLATFSDLDASFYVQGGGMEFVHAYAKAGGHDSAELHGSERKERFKSAPDDHYAKLVSGSAYLRAKFFETVDAYSMGGNDSARMLGSSGDDTYEGQKDFSRFYGDEFDVTAHNFSKVVAHAGQGGDDVANLTDSALRDELHAKAYKTELFDLATKGDVYKITARSFDRVHVEASEGGFDKAKLWDTARDDLVEATGDQVTLSSMRGGLETIYEVLAFEWVRVRSFHGGNNTSNVTEPLAIDFALEGIWDQ